jgi:asparagine synthetase B (glutamine-hydrolysing)
MCGLVGVLVFGNSNFVISADFLIKMRDTMVHRGLGINPSVSLVYRQFKDMSP